MIFKDKTRTVLLPVRPREPFDHRYFLIVMRNPPFAWMPCRILNLMVSALDCYR